jgi:hypothetical protein
MICRTVIFLSVNSERFLVRFRDRDEKKTEQQLKKCRVSYYMM